MLLDFNRYGGRVFGELTGEIVGQKLATILDDKVKSAPIINGTPSDLKYAKDIAGQAVVKNPNYGHPLMYQRPFNGRFGLRMTF